MKHRTIGGVIATVIIGVLLALAMHHNEVNRGQLGREAFLAKQGARYDRHFATPDALSGEIITCVIATGILFGVYELVALGISSTLKRLDGEGKERKSSGPPLTTPAPH